MCMGCTIADAAELESHSGFTSYELTSIKSPIDFNFEVWNGLGGRNEKCRDGNDRLAKAEDLTKRQCYQLCIDTPNCKYFSYGEDFAPNSSDREDCILCQSAGNLEGHTGFFTYEIV